MRRVLFVNHVARLGGGELSLVDIASGVTAEKAVALFESGPLVDRLKAKGVEARLMARGGGVQSVSRGSGPLTALKSGPAIIGLARQLARAAEPYDVIYANSQKAMIVSAVAGKLGGKPVIWHLRDMMLPSHFGLVQRQAAKFFSRWGVTRVIANSKATRNAYIASGGLPNRTVTVYNAVSPGRVSEAGETSRIRSELGIGDAPLVSSFSRLAKWKGQHVLLEAVRQLPNVHVLVVGGALFDDDGEYAATLHMAAAEPSLKGRVHMVGFKKDISPFVQASDVVVHTSVAPEPFGRVIVEGMMAGKPVIAAAAGGALEIIDHGRTGFLVEPGNDRALADAIRRLTEDSSICKEIGQAGREESARRFSIPRLIRDIEYQIDDVVSML